MRAALATLLLAGNAWAQTPNAPLTAVIEGRLEFTLQAWSATCKNLDTNQSADCGIPLPVSDVKALKVELDLAPVAKPGEAAQVFEDFVLKNSAGDNVMQGRLTSYSVFPPAETGFPPYLQIRFEITKPVRVLCLQSVRFKARPIEVPPQICAGFDAQHSQQWGITLTNRDATPQPQ